jgi:hypothetical protein
MRIRVIALNTFAGFLRNKLIILFLALFLCVVLLMIAPLLMFRAMPAVEGTETVRSSTLTLVGVIMSLVSGFGSLLAAWATLDTTSSEIKSGTILTVLARPVRRWEFLLGKYLGVQLLMAIYVVLMLGLSYLLAWIGGGRIQPAPWLLVVYPMVRYALYSALALALGTVLHPILAFEAVLVTTVLAHVVAPPGGPHYLPAWLSTGLYVLLPSPGVLSEARFLAITEAALKSTPPLDHLIALAYGLDWALVFFLLAAWSFRARSLCRD